MGLRADMGGRIDSVVSSVLGVSYLARNHFPGLVWVSDIGWYAASTGTLWKRMDTNVQIGVTDPLLDPAVWSPSNTSSTLVLTNGNRTVAWAASGFGASGSRGYIGKSSGKYAWEVFADLSSSDSFQTGLSNSAFDASIASQTYTLGATADSIGWLGTTIKYNGATLATMPSIATGDIIQHAADFDLKLYWIRKTGGQWNGSPTADPATGVGGLSIAGLGSGLLYPAAVLYNSTAAKATSRFSASQMSAQISGFTTFG